MEGGILFRRRSGQSDSGGGTGSGRFRRHARERSVCIRQDSVLDRRRSCQCGGRRIGSGCWRLPARGGCSRIRSGVARVFFRRCRGKRHFSHIGFGSFLRRGYGKRNQGSRIGNEFGRRLGSQGLLRRRGIRNFDRHNGPDGFGYRHEGRQFPRHCCGKSRHRGFHALRATAPGWKGCPDCNSGGNAERFFGRSRPKRNLGRNQGFDKRTFGRAWRTGGERIRGATQKHRRRPDCDGAVPDRVIHQMPHAGQSSLYPQHARADGADRFVGLDANILMTLSKSHRRPYNSRAFSCRIGAGVH